MKTAISLPDPLFKRVDWLAKFRGVSRSQLIARALDDYLSRFEGDAITEALNRVYGEQPSELDEGLALAQTEALRTDEL
ncbi:MAG: ribbon-helix-helix protein, CopG family [Ardenticatenales bacterium]